MKKSNIMWGLFFILCAVLIVLNAFDLFSPLSLWTVLLTIFLVVILINSLIKINFFGIFMSIAVLGILYDDILHIEKLTPFPILIIGVFLSIGFEMLFSGIKIKNKIVIPTEINENENDENIYLDVKFNGCTKYIYSKNLKTITCRSKFSGVKVFFENADIMGNSADMILDFWFGGLEIYVPKNWNVVDNTDTLCCGLHESGVKEQNFTKTLILNGKTRFSGIEIKYI